MKLTTFVALASACAFFGSAGVAFAQQTQQGSGGAQGSGAMAASDAKQMQRLAQDNMAEVEAGKLAVQKAQDQQVKDFAQKMVDDHTKLLDDLKKVAESKNVQLPGAPDAKHQKLMNKLQSASADKFDREYMRAMVKDHQEAVKLLNRVEKRAKDQDLKSAATQAEPQIREHLKMAQQIAKSEKSAGKSGKRSASGQSGEPQGSQAGAAR